MERKKRAKPQISVIIPAYNEEKYILKTLQSLANQEYPDFEVIVVLSGCTDKTEDVVKRFIKLRPELNISLVTEPKLGVSLARNKGAKYARGNILFFLDADTYLDYNCLFKINQYMNSDFAIGTCHSKPIPKKFLFSIIVGFKNMIHRLRLVKGIHGTFICHRGHFEKVAGYNEELVIMEHRDLILKLLPFGKYLWIPTAFATTSMRRWQQNGTLTTLFYWIEQGMKKLVQKNNLTKTYEAVR